MNNLAHMFQLLITKIAERFEPNNVLRKFHTIQSSSLDLETDRFKKCASAFVGWYD